ncbi:MAG: TatD family hydrolase, partial [Patescibacteria group bacterium]|nr:TatD family hydrolase [Patescibacteria group bacterium]
GKKIVAIGEIGFDFGPHGTKQPANKQEDVFRKQLQLARKFKLPVIVHTRDADELTMKVLNDFTDVKLVVHCYQSGTDLTEMILKNPNWLFSFTGLITFQKRTEHILEVIKMVSIEKIMIETDAPFLAPVPYRGQINEPSFVAEVAKKIAMIKDLPLEKVAEQTTKNAEEFFGI